LDECSKFLRTLWSVSLNDLEERYDTSIEERHDTSIIEMCRGMLLFKGKRCQDHRVVSDNISYKCGGEYLPISVGKEVIRLYG
jgi:hypothetical protein